MTDVETLLAIESIKRLKARYFYHLDHQDWAGWKKDVFASDASLFVPEIQPDPIVGIDAIIAWVSARADGQISVHHGHMPDIEILSENSAKAIWAMEDRLYKPKELAERLGYTTLHGFGHYHEEYVRNADGWRIKSTHLTRILVNRT